MKRRKWTISIEITNLELKVSGCARGLCDLEHVISFADIEATVRNLKHNKYDGSTGHCTDHVIHSPRTLIYSLYIALLFSSMLRHGFLVDGFHITTIIPIPKNKKKSLDDPENYRGITLSSILGNYLTV